MMRSEVPNGLYCHRITQDAQLMFTKTLLGHGKERGFLESASLQEVCFKSKRISAVKVIKLLPFRSKSALLYCAFIILG